MYIFRTTNVGIEDHKAGIKLLKLVQMKLFEFLKLSDEEQYDATWEKGARVDLYLKDNIAIELYAINTFYVEIYYERNTTERLYKKTFKQGELLNKYLDRIQLKINYKF